MIEALVRDAQVEDLDALVQLSQASFTDPWSRAMFCDSLDCYHVRVTERSGKVTAYIVWMAAAGNGEILHIATDPAHRGQGLASVLIEDMLKQGRTLGVQDWFLEVRQSNLAAQKLYRQFGFIQAGRRKDYYPTLEGTREDAIVMTRGQSC